MSDELAMCSNSQILAETKVYPGIVLLYHVEPSNITDENSSLRNPISPPNFGNLTKSASAWRNPSSSSSSDIAGPSKLDTLAKVSESALQAASAFAARSSSSNGSHSLRSQAAFRMHDVARSSREAVQRALSSHGGAHTRGGGAPLAAQILPGGSSANSGFTMTPQVAAQVYGIPMQATILFPGNSPDVMFGTPTMTSMRQLNITRQQQQPLAHTIQSSGAAVSLDRSQWNAQNTARYVLSLQNPSSTGREPMISRSPAQTALDNQNQTIGDILSHTNPSQSNEGDGSSQHTPPRGDHAEGSPKSSSLHARQSDRSTSSSSNRYGIVAPLTLCVKANF